MVVGWRPIAVPYTLDFVSVSSKGMLNIETTKGYVFNLKFVRYMKKTYSQMHCKNKYSHLT